MQNEVSLCMIVKNEEGYLPNCLNSVQDIVDEIIIVDTGSTDNTVEIAKSFGAKIYYFKWNNNFSEARNESLKYATKDWILIMDADDEIYPIDRENLKMLLNSELDEKAIYYFETLSYYGNKVDNNNITINLNPRLFKNNRVTHYEGSIHNQLISTEHQYNAVCNEIKIHHYGYLDKCINSQDKRNRNIAILNEQIKNNPDNKFAYFNLGNEYSALDNIEKALECYYNAYENFDYHKGYGWILLLKIINANYYLGNFDEALKFVDIGVNYFPQCTDLYYFKALIYGSSNRPTLQIKALEKCIELGDPPSELKFIHGTGGFRAYYELGNVYMHLMDYEPAYNYYIQSMKLNPNFIDPLYNIIHILKLQNLPLDKIKILIESFFTDYPKAYTIIADLFYNEGDYETSLEYLNKCKEPEFITESVMILKAKCLARIGAFDEFSSMEAINKNYSSYLNFSMYKVLGELIENNPNNALSVINNFKENTLSEHDKKLIEVYYQLINLFTNEPTTILCEENDDKEYMSIIFEILEILLMNNKLDAFKAAVNLLNLTNSNFVLLHLGKLYYKYGYIDIGKKEILRSIKEFEIYDEEGLNILLNR